MLRLFRRAAPADPATIAIAHEGRTFPVAIRRRTGARRLTLRVSGPDLITLTAPPHASLASLERFATAQAGWIALRLARLPRPIVFEPGALVPIRGVPHRIVLRDGARGPVRLERDAAGTPLLSVAGDPATLPGRLRRHLAAEAGRDLREAVGRHAAALGAKAGRVAIRDTRSRWGSCSSTGTLSFSWRLVMAPPLVLNYLAAHEVAHLREMNHSQRFWRLVRTICPATDEAEIWLKRHGGDLHRYG